MIAGVFALLLATVVVIADGPEARPLSVRALVEAGPHYVGQEIAVQVTVIAEGTRPAVRPPRVAGARIESAGTSFQALTTSAIGDVVHETNQYRYHYRLIPERTGTLPVGPFTAVVGDRRGASAPFRLQVRPWPVDRPGTFTGGIGRVAVTTEAVPSAVRLGEAFEYRIRLDGPGAAGATANPLDRSRVEALSIAPEVELLPAETTSDPPARLFRYRIRPARPGSAVLPAVPLAWLEPKTGRFQTVVGPPVPVRVADVPAFNPDSVIVPSAPRPGGDWSGPIGAVLGIVVSALVLIGAGLNEWWQRRRERRASPSFVARRLAAELCGLDPSTVDPRDLAGRVDQALRRGLEAVASRPMAAVTPDEARQAIIGAGVDEALAGRIETLLEAVDRIRFGPAAGQPDLTAPGVRDEALAVLELLSRNRARILKSESAARVANGMPGLGPARLPDPNPGS